MWICFLLRPDISNWFPERDNRKTNSFCQLKNKKDIRRWLILIKLLAGKKKFIFFSRFAARIKITQKVAVASECDWKAFIWFRFGFVDDAIMILFHPPENKLIASNYFDYYWFFYWTTRKNERFDSCMAMWPINLKRNFASEAEYLMNSHQSLTIKRLDPKINVLIENCLIKHTNYRRRLKFEKCVAPFFEH